MFWFYTQNKANSKKELALSASSLTFLASGSSLDLNIISNIPQDEITYEVNSTGIFTVTRSGYKLTIETDNLGATVTPQQSSTLTVKARNLTATCTLIREANYIKSLKIGGGSTTSFIPSTITYSAAGGSNPFTGWAVYTSGGQTCITTWAAGDWVLSQSYFSKILSNGIVTVTGEYRGTTVGSSRTGTLTVNLKSAATKNKQLSTSVTLTQAENKKSYGGLTVNDFHYPKASSNSTTSTPVVVVTQATSYSSGAKSSEEVIGERKFVISGTVPSYVSINSSTGVLTWQSNTSGSTRSVIVSLTVTANGYDVNNSYNASQSAGVKTYSNVTVSLKYSQIPAKGGTVTPTISYSQTWGWNGATTGGGTITTGGTVTYSGATNSNGSVTADSKKAALSGVTDVATVTAKVSLNGKEGTAAYTVQQAENKRESVVIRAAGSFEDPVTSFPASGNTIYYTAHFTLTTEWNTEYSEIPLSAWSLSSTEGFVLKGTYYVNVTATNRGSTLGDARSTTLKFSYYGLSSQITLTQEANTRRAVSTTGGTVTYSDITAGTITNATIPAKGGSATATAGVGKQPWARSQEFTTYEYSSGETKKELTGLASSGTNNVNPSISSINATASSKGTVVSNQTVVKSQAVTWSANGKSASGTMYIYQQENKVVSTEYAIPVISTFTYPDIPAKGGTVTPTLVWSQTAEDTYTSEQSKDRTITTGGTVTYSGSAVNFQNGSYTQGTKGTTESARNKCITATVTVVINNRTGTKTTDIYQAANTKTTTYSDITITAFGYSEAPASGSTLSPTLSYKQTKTDSYTSEASVPTTITSGASIAYSGNGVNTSTGAVTVPSRGTVEGSRTGYTSSTVTVSNSGKTAKSTVTVFQAANEVTSKKITPRTPVPQTDTLPATNAYYSYDSGECDLVYKYSSGASKVEMSIGELGASQYGLGVTFQLVDSSDDNIKASGNNVTFGINTTTSERYAIVNMKFISNESDWISDIYQIKITQEAKSGPGTLTIKFLRTSPQIAWYVTTSIGSNGVVVTGPTRYTVTSSLNGFNILENELAVLLAINPGSGNIYVNLSATSGGTVSYKATLSQLQAASLSNGTNISIFAVKNV